MPIFERGTLVRVPFPYTDRDTRQRRPALVVSDGAVGPEASLLWVVMVTSAANRRWPDDVALTDDYQACGLPAPSLIRIAKIATIDCAAAESLGRLDDARLSEVMAAIARALALGV
jgi:mRNA interferase MazF